MSSKVNKNKLFIVKTYVMATSASEAIRKSRKLNPDEVWIDDEWKKGQANQLASAIGFDVTTNEN